MNYNGISFNHLFWVGKTLQEFVKHESHHGLTINQLEEAFYIINPKKDDDTETIKQSEGSKARGNNKPVSVKDK